MVQKLLARDRQTTNWWFDKPTLIFAKYAKHVKLQSASEQNFGLTPAPSRRFATRKG
jgi:hypothetical protein